MSSFTEKFKIGKIFWFKNPRIRSPDPHPHVCVGNDGEKCVFLFCGTSQFEKKLRHFEINDLPFETLVRIQPNSTNTLTKDTYINCNEVQTHTFTEIASYNPISPGGEVSESELYQIRNAIEISELLEQDIQQYILKIFPGL